MSSPEYTESDTKTFIRLGYLCTRHSADPEKPFFYNPRQINRTNAGPDFPDEELEVYGREIADIMSNIGLNPKLWGTMTPEDKQWLPANTEDGLWPAQKQLRQEQNR